MTSKSHVEVFPASSVTEIVTVVVPDTSVPVFGLCVAKSVLSQLSENVAEPV